MPMREPPIDALIDIRIVPRPERHRLIFRSFERLSQGDALILVNDHDPRPLAHHFGARYGGAFGWQYLEQGPDVWRVRISRTR
jgi:uncharacterized protein (DUF2249 family)